MSLSLTLNNALTGLRVSQQGLATTSNNVANANSANYSRQELVISPQVVGKVGSGARVDQIIRKIDEYVNRATQQQTSAVQQTTTVAEYLSRVQTFMGEPGEKNSLDEYIEGFFNILQGLAETPELTSYRSQAVNAGFFLANELSTLAGSIEDLRYQADQEIRSEVNNLNFEIMRLYEVNKNLGLAAAMGEPVADLLDQRDASIATISSLIDVRAVYQESGQVYLYTNSGQSVLERTPYQFSYAGIGNIATLQEDGLISPMYIQQISESGNPIGNKAEVVSSGYNHDITTIFRSGKIKGLLDVRDQQLPNILDQIDQLAATIRDEVNRIHNSGSGIPAATSLTGDRAIGLDDALEWTGVARIAVLNSDGTAVESRYGNTETGFLPLDIDFDSLRSKYGNLLTVDTIINEINTHFQPQNNAVVNNLQNISLATLSNQIPDTGDTFNFDFELSNISNSAANFWVSNIEVLDDSNISIDNQNVLAANSINFDAANTFITTLNSNVITVNATGHGYAEGETIFIDGLTGPVNGIPAADLNGKTFKVTNVTPNGFQIEVASAATSTGMVSMAGAEGTAADAKAGFGMTSRTGGSGFTANLGGNPTSAFYTVRATVMVEDDNGELVATTIDYIVDNNQTEFMNKRYAARAIGPDGELVVPGAQAPLAKAQLVDENGQVITDPGQKGYLQIVAGTDPLTQQTYTLSIDDLSSQELGRPNDNPPQQGTGRGFSHFFGLNNFFVGSETTATGNKTAGSALNMKVRQDIIDNPNLISTGTLTQVYASTAEGQYPSYAYERTTGDSSIAQKLAGIGLQQFSFGAAGGLATTVKTFNGYAAELLGFASANSSTAEQKANDAQILLDSYEEKRSAVSGVNVDEEMANTIIFQNSYAASSKVIATVKDLFDTLLSIV